VSAPVPARTWHSTCTAAFTLSIEQTDGGASGVQLWISGPYDGMSVLLDRAQTGELVTDLLRRLALIGGRHAAVRAAADPSIAAQRSAQPPPGRVWTVSDSGRHALRGPESAGTGPAGGLPPTAPGSPGSVDAGGSR
jgi:hypothetical protein